MSWKRSLAWSSLIVGLSACGMMGQRPEMTDGGAAVGMAQDTPATPAAEATARPQLSTDILPSYVATGVVKGTTPLLERPTRGSVIVRSLEAGTEVQVLGDLENADGHWLSVGLGDRQGWVRLDAIQQGN